MKPYIIIIIMLAIIVSGCTGSTVIPIKNNTTTTPTISINIMNSPTPTPYPDGTFSLTASYNPPTSSQLDVRMNIKNYNINNIEAIAWFVNKTFYKSYYLSSSGGQWKEHFPGDDQTHDKVINNPYDLYYSSNTTGPYTIGASIYGFNKNSDGGQVWLGFTNDIDIK